MNYRQLVNLNQSLNVTSDTRALCLTVCTKEAMFKLVNRQTTRLPPNTNKANRTRLVNAVSSLASVI